MVINEVLIGDNPMKFMGRPTDQCQLEHMIFCKASQSESYHGGEWRYMLGERNIFFMAPKSNESFILRSELGASVSLCSESFGVFITAQAMLGLSVSPRYQFLNTRRLKLINLLSCYPSCIEIHNHLIGT